MNWGAFALGMIGIVFVGRGLIAHVRRRTVARFVGFALGGGCLLGAGGWAISSRGDAFAPPSTVAENRFRVLRIGTPAPDFTLPDVASGEPVHLADLVGHRPVVLVLGSFGCDYFCYRLDAVRELHERFGTRAEFLFVYIDNDHKDPEWLQGVEADPTAGPDSPVNRHARIVAGMKKYQLDLPCVDDVDADQVVKAYQASPAKLVIIDEAGQVAFDSGAVNRSGLMPDKAADWLEHHTPVGQTVGDDNQPAVGAIIDP